MSHEHGHSHGEHACHGHGAPQPHQHQHENQHEKPNGRGHAHAHGGHDHAHEHAECKHELGHAHGKRVSVDTNLSVRPLVVCGPSGVGKGTLLTRLLSELPQFFGKSVSHTTRQPRKGEVNGTSYHFVTKEEFQLDIDAGKFIEHANVHGNFYGTSISSVEYVSRHGKICILEIDIQGAEKVKKTSLEPYFFFISPPNFDELSARLRGRQTEDEQTIKTRLETARTELSFYQSNPSFFHQHLINNDLEHAYHELKLALCELYPFLKETITPAQHIDTDSITKQVDELHVNKTA